MTQQLATDTYDPKRPVMDALELAEHPSRRTWGRDYNESDDGYSDMEAEHRRGWRVVSAWGRDGWDLGDWPYVAYMIRCRAGLSELLQLCEGDRSYWAFDDADDLNAALDLLLWQTNDYVRREITGRDDPTTYGGVAPQPPDRFTLDVRFRGPYREVGHD